MVQWLGLFTYTAKGAGLIPGWGNKILQTAGRGQKLKKKKVKRNEMLDRFNLEIAILIL